MTPICRLPLSVAYSYLSLISVCQFQPFNGNCTEISHKVYFPFLWLVGLFVWKQKRGDKVGAHFRSIKDTLIILKQKLTFSWPQRQCLSPSCTCFEDDNIRLLNTNN